MMTDAHTILANRSWSHAAIWLLTLGPIAIAVAIWLASFPVVHDAIENPPDRICADDPDRFAIINLTTPVTSDISMPPPCVQENVTGDTHEVTPAPGTKIRVYIGPDGRIEVTTD